MLADTPYLAFYPAVIAAAAFGGTGPGLLATVASLLCVDLLFIPPIGYMDLRDPLVLARVAIFLLGGIGVSVLAGMHHSAQSKQRKQAEQLAETVQVLDLANVLARDMDDRIIRWNTGCQRLYGFTADQAIGQVSHDLLQTRFPQPLEAIRAMLLETGRWEGELVHTAADGRDIAVASEWLLFRNALGQATAILEVNADISERRRVEEDLASVAEFLSETPNPVLRINSEGRVLYANVPAEELLTGEGWRRGGAMPTGLCEPASMTLRDGTPHECEFTSRNKRVLMFLCVPVTDKGYVNLYGHDVTDTRRIEAALRRSEDRYRGMVQASAAAVWTADTHGRISEDSPSWRAYTGQTLDQFLGYGWLQAIHPQDRPRVESDWLTAFETGTLYQTEYRLWHQGSDSYRHTMARGVRVLNEDGSTREWVGVNIDVAELRQAEVEQARLAAIVDTSHDAILSKNLEGIIQSWNSAAEQIFGYRAAEMIGQPVSRLLPPENRGEMDHIMNRLRAGERIENFETVRITNDGRRLDVSVSIAPIRDLEGQVIGASTITRDISARKAMEESLRQNEQRFRSFVEATTQVVWTTNLRGEVDMAIPSWQAYTGQTEEQARGFGWTNAIREEDRDRVAAAWQKAFESSGLYEVEYLLRIHDGSWRNILARGVPVRNPDGSVREYIGVCIDITAQKRAEEAFQKSQQQFRTLADAIPQLAWMARADGWIHWYNQRWYEYTGTTCEEMEGWGWQSVHDPQVLPAVLQRWQATLATGQPFDMTFPLRGADGVFRPFLTRIMPLKDEQGEIVQWFGTNTDITEQRQTEMALRKSEERLALAASGARIGMFEWHVASGNVVCTKQLAQLVGIVTTTAATPATLSAACHYADWAERVHPDDLPRVEAEARRCISESLPFEAEYRVVWTDGSEHWLVTRGYFEKDAEGQTRQMLGIVMDTTERKKFEEDLKAARESAEQANRAKDHFLAVLSHELRTPLTPVVMGVSMLQDRADLDAGVRESLEMIRRNVEMEARLIDDLLDVSRIARGKIELHRSPVALCTILHQAVEVCRPDIEARKLHFGVDIGPSAPYWIHADASRLQQVFWNLLKNAIKFTPHDGCVGVRCRPIGDHVLVEVNDSGIGIEAESLKRVFNAFEQAERSITRQFGGLGLGLAISKALVEMHGGQISAHSEGRDKGAAFRVLLPLATPASSPEAPLPAKPPHRVVRPLRILLVEDHGVTARMMKMLLTVEGHSVDAAGDVATALEHASRTRFDLLMSDLGLPDGSGHDLMRQLRERGHTFPGIALSGYGQEEDIRRSHEAGFAAHLTKPASRERLLEAIASVVTEQAASPREPDGTIPG